MSFHGFEDQLVQGKLLTARYLVIPKFFYDNCHGCPVYFSNPVPLVGEIVVFWSGVAPGVPQRRDLRLRQKG